MIAKSVEEALQLAKNKQEALEIRQRLTHLEKFIQAVVDYLGLEFQCHPEVIRCVPKKEVVENEAK